MKHRDRPPEQDDLLRPRLVDLIDMRHELVKLAALIDWEFFEREWAGFFPSGTGRPATPPRLVTGLMYLQHLHRLSDEKPLAATWGRDTALMSFFKGFFSHFGTPERFLHCGPPKEGARSEDVGEQALMRGLDTA